MDERRRKELLGQLVDRLAAERGVDAPLQTSAEGLWTVFRALVNLRDPVAADAELLSLQDELLQGLLEEAGVHTLEEAEPSPLDGRMMLWRGDLTTLAVDAVVNAASSRLLGCWQPGHLCLDNQVHTFAGIQLRLECSKIMKAQGRDEPPGRAKLTQGWNLPAKRVLHTVPPVVGQAGPTDDDRRLLVSCHTSCLDLAHACGLESVAFCCISSGTGGFPLDQGCRIAVDTVREWLARHAETGMAVVFCASSDEEEMHFFDELKL